ncbi:MAG: hypothetical protein O9326_22140 [Microcystis sp. LE19-338.1B]|nr:hypothetical protein [Microcystis sp. LE19-338.1B]MCZ8359021.1 hypothetical protein [Microcystis sp. LE19-388.1G]
MNLETAFGTSYDVVKATQLPLRETEKTGFPKKPVFYINFCDSTPERLGIVARI